MQDFIYANVLIYCPWKFYVFRVIKSLSFLMSIRSNLPNNINYALIMRVLINENYLLIKIHECWPSLLNKFLKINFPLKRFCNLILSLFKCAWSVDYPFILFTVKCRMINVNNDIIQIVELHVIKCERYLKYTPDPLESVPWPR